MAPGEMETIIKRCTETVDFVSKQEIPPSVWRRCAGVAIVNITEVGFIFSMGEGDGVLMKKREDGNWGPPSAIMYTGSSGGFVFGKGHKQLILFPMTDYGFRQLTAKNKYQIGVQMGLAIGPIGREASLDVDVGGHGVGATLSYCIQNGAFVSIGINNDFISEVRELNEEFYGQKDITADDVAVAGKVEIPKGKGVEELQAKLKELSQK